MLVDRNARFSRKPVAFEARIFFGQLQNIFVIKIPASPVLELKETTTLILAAVRTCTNPQRKRENNVYYYSWEGSLEVIDLNCVQCLVG